MPVIRTYQDIKHNIKKYQEKNVEKCREISRNHMRRKRAFQKVWLELCAIEL